MQIKTIYQKGDLSYAGGIFAYVRALRKRYTRCIGYARELSIELYHIRPDPTGFTAPPPPPVRKIITNQFYTRSLITEDAPFSLTMAIRYP